ncbi:nebulin-related-anchoring protein isoform X2 [Protopterus annectens]|uniref:nebulin-related-anchoring protein isoform X2 n=1 Tax=Protopterus annectens TaxID=7888 RepID=UPI001CFA1303|nr:nebulin-related-anchoring protein isoform X2 [Protopterus annectens]
MNVQACARCGHGVYPAEKINCIDQTWHKSCFHCEVCKMILTVNNFISYKKKPYCHVHNPKNNTFTSVYETPLNIHAKKQTEEQSEIKYKEDAEKFKSIFHWDMKSRNVEHVHEFSEFTTQGEYRSGHEEHISMYSTSGMQQARTTGEVTSDLKYIETCQQQKGKGSFPAMITPAYQIAKKASELASGVEYRRGHEEQMSRYTTVVDTPQILHAKAGGQMASDIRYMQEYEEQKGKGSFPALITPGYQIAKKASELASNIKYQQRYMNDIKGKASHVSRAEGSSTTEEGAFGEDVYMEDFEERQGKGSFPAMITPAYQNAKKANQLASDNTYKKDLEHTKGHSINYCETPQFKNMAKVSKYTSDVKYKENYRNQMKGHYEGVGMDKRTLHAMKVNTLASDINYKSDKELDKVDYFYPATATPSYVTTKKLEPLKDVNYRQHIDKLKYSSVAETREMAQAKINAKQLSDINYRAHYEKTKTQYTLPKDVPQLVKAKANADLFSDIKYKEVWQKSKDKDFDMKLDSISILAAKASRDLASDIKYKEAYEKTKGRATGTEVSDSRLLHSLQVAKLSSERAYKEGFEQSKTHFHLPLDMVNLKHAQKAQVLASDLDYRTRLHEYTTIPEDMKVSWAKKAYNLQSENLYRSDLTWMRGVGWVTQGSLDVQQAKKAGDLASEKKYRQKVDALKFTSVADTPHIKHAKKSQELQSDLIYKSGTEQALHQYSISKDEPLFRQARANAEYLSQKMYKSSWEKQKEKGFELHLDAIPILTAKSKRDLASDIKYREEYEKTKGKWTGVKGVSEDTQMAHSLQVSKLQSDLAYKKGFEDAKTKYHVSMDMVDLVHARKAQSLATDKGYKTLLHQYTALPTDMKVEWAKKAYNLQSDKLYRSDLNWMKGVGWVTAGSLNAEQAKKAGEYFSERKYRQHPYALKFTSVHDSPEMIQAKISYNQAVDRLYKERGENIKHQYTLTKDLPELLQAKENAMNISEIRYKESWRKLQGGGYKLRLDAIPFQAAKASSEIISDYKYKEAFERMKGRMVGPRGLDDDIKIAHSVQASQVQSNLGYRKEFEDSKTQFHLPMDMVDIVHAKKAQSLVSDQDYKQMFHHYTTLSDDLKIQAAKRAYELQSEKMYRSDLNFLRGVAWISTGAVQIEGVKKATDLISEKKYRQRPDTFKYTTVTDSPDILHAKFSNMITNERLYKAAGEDLRHHYTMTVGLPEMIQAKINAANFSEAKYRESWYNQRAQGYKLTMEAIPFQTAKASRAVASDYQYKHNFVMERGKHIGARSILDDPKLLHCIQVAKLQSSQLYRKEFEDTRSKYHLSLDMMNLVHAQKAQTLASGQDYRTRLHEYTSLPDDMKLQWAKEAHKLQSETQYKSDLKFMKGVGWMTAGSPHIESVKKAGELVSEKKYRQHPDTLKFTAVVDSPDMVHAKNSYLQCSERLYRSGDSDMLHRYTLPPDHPDFIRARINAQHISDKAYKTSWEKTRAGGCDLRLDAIPFQTAKASREIASDFKYKEAFVKEKGHQIGFRSIYDDPKMKHVMNVSKLQSGNEYKKQYKETQSQYQLPLDQPGFTHAKKSQQQASNINYRQQLHDYTCDPEQLNMKHAKEAYKLQSDVAYKSDLNWIRGIGWTPPGYHKVEMARRAAELGYTQGQDPQEALAQYEQMLAARKRLEEEQYPNVNPDAAEILQVKRKQMHLPKK